MPCFLVMLLLIQCQKSTGQSNGSLSTTTTTASQATSILSTSATTASNSTTATNVNATLPEAGVSTKDITTIAANDTMVSDWSEWKCTKNCSVRDMIRTRSCLSGPNKVECILPLEETKPAECYKNHCPLNCIWKTYGENCKFSCPNCNDMCDKFDGYCSVCINGFEFPESGCKFDRRNYETWSPWTCGEDCKNPHYIRVRNCKRDQDNNLVGGCKDPVYDRKPGNCFIGKTCPKDCADYKWGVNCNGSCVNCMKPCNKFTGVCESCRPGFQTPELYCSEACFLNQYGFDCKGNCFDKCGEDCVERVTGSCRDTSTKSFYLFYLLLLLIPISIFIYFVMQRKQEIDVALKKSMPEQRVTKSKVALVLEASKSMQSLKSNRSDKSLRDSTMSLRSLKALAGEEGGQSMASSRAALSVGKDSGMRIHDVESHL